MNTKYFFFLVFLLKRGSKTIWIKRLSNHLGKLKQATLEKHLNRFNLVFHRTKFSWFIERLWRTEHSLTQCALLHWLCLFLAFELLHQFFFFFFVFVFAKKFQGRVSAAILFRKIGARDSTNDILTGTTFKLEIVRASARSFLPLFLSALCEEEKRLNDFCVREKGAKESTMTCQSEKPTLKMLTYSNACQVKLN